ncbi:MAG: hypothetical protein ACKO34_07855 [Vampirovibrionales bacterium]
MRDSFSNPTVTVVSSTKPVSRVREGHALTPLLEMPLSDARKVLLWPMIGFTGLSGGAILTSPAVQFTENKLLHCSLNPLHFLQPQSTGTTDSTSNTASSSDVKQASQTPWSRLVYNFTERGRRHHWLNDFGCAVMPLATVSTMLAFTMAGFSGKQPSMVFGGFVRLLVAPLMGFNHSAGVRYLNMASSGWMALGSDFIASNNTKRAQQSSGKIVETLRECEAIQHIFKSVAPRKFETVGDTLTYIAGIRGVDVDKLNDCLRHTGGDLVYAFKAVPKVLNQVGHLVTTYPQEVLEKIKDPSYSLKLPQLLQDDNHLSLSQMSTIPPIVLPTLQVGLEAVGLGIVSPLMRGLTGLATGIGELSFMIQANNFDDLAKVVRLAQVAPRKNPQGVEIPVEKLNAVLKENPAVAERLAKRMEFDALCMRLGFGFSSLYSSQWDKDMGTGLLNTARAFHGALPLGLLGSVMMDKLALHLNEGKKLETFRW